MALNGEAVDQFNNSIRWGLDALERDMKLLVLTPLERHILDQRVKTVRTTLSAMAEKNSANEEKVDGKKV